MLRRLLVGPTPSRLVSAMSTAAFRVQHSAEGQEFSIALDDAGAKAFLKYRR